MATHFDSELQDLRQRLLTMASYATRAVESALKAVVERDDDLARQVEDSDRVIDDLETEVDEAAIHLLLRAPLARDLRFIVVSTKIGHDLERVGDEATSIARRAIELNREPPLSDPPQLEPLAKAVVSMLWTALEAFINDDGPSARLIIPQDKEVDAHNKRLQQQFTSAMIANPEVVTRLLAYMTISRRLERIGDHAKNIAEEVVYLSEARDIRHTQRAGDATGAPPAP